MATKESEPKNILEYVLFQKLEMLTAAAVSVQDENMEGSTFMAFGHNASFKSKNSGETK